ncbi:hypothetical protein XF36_02050 [Pseudonocardia sp. HH130629-09]|nr:hypothetical protein XF36_02050 [Pseudonocardia sp. HH130629-09]
MIRPSRAGFVVSPARIRMTVPVTMPQMFVARVVTSAGRSPPAEKKVAAPRNVAGTNRPRPESGPR